jgi:hypothetical protein
VSPERSFKSKAGQEIRDKQGMLIYPLITIERIGVVKDPQRKGTVWANVIPVNDEKGGSIPVARFINQVKTTNFAGADAKKTGGEINFPRQNDKVVYQTVSIPLPVYIVCNYKITIRTEYQQQVNELTAPFITRPGGINYILLKEQGHRFEAFVDQAFNQTNNVADFSEDERYFETSISIDVMGYLIGAEGNQEKPFYAIRENVVEVKIPRERIMLSEIPEHEKGVALGVDGLPISVENTFLPKGAFGNAPSMAQNMGSGLKRSDFVNQASQVFAIKELMSPSPDGSNKVFKFLGRLRDNTERVYINGQLQYPTLDYDVIDAYTIEFKYAPETTDNLLIDYIKQ